MRPGFLAIALTAAAAVASACGAKQRNQTPPAITEPQSHAVAPPPTRTEAATGSVREAMLHLQRVHFALDSATLMPEGRAALQKAAEQLRLLTDVHIYIDGHTDLRGTTEYNLALGETRARTVAEYLVHLGIPATRLHVMTFGKERPVALERTALAHARNRRAEFRLMRGTVQLVLAEGVLFDDQGRKLAASAQ